MWLHRIYSKNVNKTLQVRDVGQTWEKLPKIINKQLDTIGKRLLNKLIYKKFYICGHFDIFWNRYVINVMLVTEL